MHEETVITNVMIVDDHPMIRDGLRARLESMPGVRVVAETGTADEALRHAAHQPINLVLMDINLQGSSGIELTAKFQLNFPDIAVLILSMHNKAEYVLQSIRAGARGYVLKDAPGSDIVRAIEAVLNGGVYYSAALLPIIAQPRLKEELLTVRERQVLEQIARGGVEQEHRGDAGSERAHCRNPLSEYQTQIGYRRTQRADQVRPGKSENRTRIEKR
jgi:DNA-binding NarL/FixJ family response regulator